MEQLFGYFKNNPITVKNIRAYLLKKENLKLQLLQKYDDYKNRFSFFVFVRYFLLGILDKRCLQCGRLLNNQQLRKNANYCSKLCANKSKIVKQNRRKSVIEKYGVENISQLENVKQKKIDSCFKNYGVGYPLQSKLILQNLKKTNLQKHGTQFVLQKKQIRQKINKTVIQRYGVQNVSQLEQVKNKVKKTNLQKYGNECSLLGQIAKNKTKQTNLKKYGTQHPTQNQMIKEKIKQTNLQKYGVEYALQNKRIMGKTKQSNLKKYGSQNYFSSDEFCELQNVINYQKLIEKCKNYVIPMFQKQDYKGFRSQIPYKWKCVFCSNQWQQTIHMSSNKTFDKYIPRCLKCYPYVGGFSNLEKQVVDFVKSICEFQIIQNDKNIISPYEIDVYIPQKSMGIQFDGLIWHSNKFKKDDFNLLHKTQKCQQIGIKLIHVFQDEWIYNKDFVKKMIKLNFEDNVNVYDYAEKIQGKYIFDRRYFSKFDFKNQQINYTEPQKFYIKNNQRINQTQQNLYYVFDCGNLIV